MRIQVQRCTEEQLPEAAKLTAEVHARTRKNEPLLPESYEDPSVSVRQIAGKKDIWVATRGSQVVAVLAATPGPFGAFSPPLGVAGEPDALVDVYTAAAADWVADGERTHAVHIPLGAPEIVDPFLRMGFGYQAEAGMHSLKALPDAPDVTVTRAGAEDIDELLPLIRVIPDKMALSPVFSPRSDTYYAGLREVHGGNLSSGIGRYFVARVQGRAVGLAVTNEADDGPLDPPGGRSLDLAAVDPSHRGKGVGLALTRALLADALDSGVTGVVTDWRTTNLPAAGFWPAVGFRPMCLRLSRRIDLTPR